MAKQYRKPLVHGGHRIIDRDSSGRFCRSSLDCQVCSNCGQIVPPTQVTVGTEKWPLLKWVQAEKCPSCGSSLTDGEPACQ